MSSRRALFRSGHIQLSGPNGPGGIRSAGGGRGHGAGGGHGHGAGGGHGHGAGGGHGHGRGTTLPPGQLIAALATVGAASSGKPGVVPPKATYLQTVLADSPAVYLKFDETAGTTAADSSGNNHPGTYVAPLTIGDTPLITAGHSVTNATSGTVTLPNDASFAANGRLTVEAWLKSSAAASDTRNIVTADAGFGLTRYFILRTAVTTGFLEAVFFDTGATGHTVTGTVSVLDGATHYVAASYDGANMNLWLNGSLHKQTAAVFTLATSGPNQVILGQATNVHQTIGTVDEYALYTSALSSTRIAAHYQAGL